MRIWDKIRAIWAAYIECVKKGAKHRCKYDNAGYCAECDRYDGEW